MKDALAVQVVKPPGDVQGQTDSDAPRQVEVAVQQLLQVSSIYILQTGRLADTKGGNSFLPFRTNNGDFKRFSLPLSERAVGLRARKRQET